jgi:hypothetical protein
MIDLHRYCSSDHYRPIVTRPWVHLFPGGRSYTVATNGRVGVALPGAVGLALPWAEVGRPDLARIFAPFQGDHEASLEALREWAGSPSWPPATADCEVCKGKGVTVCRGCHGRGWTTCVCSECEDEHDAQCPDCEGGRMDCPNCTDDEHKVQPGSLGPATVDRVLLARALEVFSGATVSLEIKSALEVVRVTDGRAIAAVMPIRDDETSRSSFQGLRKVRGSNVAGGQEAP